MQGLDVIIAKMQIKTASCKDLHIAVTTTMETTIYYYVSNAMH